MVEAPILAEGKYAKFYDIDEPVIRCKGGVNKIQHIQRSLVEITEEQCKDEVWSKVISWVEKGQLREKAETRDKSKRSLGSLFYYV